MDGEKAYKWRFPIAGQSGISSIFASLSVHIFAQLFCHTLTTEVCGLLR